MNIPALRCPSCEAPLRLDAPAPGKRIRCPQCREVFAIPEPDVTEPELVEEEEEREDVQPGRKKEPGGGVPRILWIALAGAVLLGAAALYRFQGNEGHSVTLGVARSAISHAKVMRQRIAIYKELSYHYRRIHDEKDAEKRRARLRELKTELEECQDKHLQLGPIDMGKLQSLYLEANEAFAQSEDDRQEAARVAEVRAILDNP